MAAISYKLENFEGPLDLLLHLIEKNKVNIYDIPIVLITEQYLEYVSRMEREDLNVVSEFLVMAATLIDIKSRMLLPAEVNEEGEEEDPRAELVARLLEYKMYKYMAQELFRMEEGAGRHLFKEATIPKEVAKYEPPVDLDELLGDLTLAKLQAVFQTVIRRREDKIDPSEVNLGPSAGSLSAWRPRSVRSWITPEVTGNSAFASSLSGRRTSWRWWSPSWRCWS